MNWLRSLWRKFYRRTQHAPAKKESDREILVRGLRIAAEANPRGAADEYLKSDKLISTGSADDFVEKAEAIRQDILSTTRRKAKEAVDAKASKFESDIQKAKGDSRGPEDAAVYYILAMDYGRFEAWTEMIAMLKKSLRIEPSTFEAYHNIGIAHCKLGEWSEAIEAYQQALKLQADHEQSRYCLGVAHLERNNTEAATEQYEALVKLNSPLAAQLSNAILTRQ